MSGAAGDNEDGSISQAISWWSNREGSIGTGANVNWTPSVTGTHVITALVSDSSGQSVTEAASVSVNTDQGPTVSLSNPSGQQTYPAGTPISLVAAATDAEDGNISHLIIWSSNLEGVIGNGGNRSWTPSVAGFHILTASVTDSGNSTGSATTSISVFQNSPPLVSISSPSENQALAAGNEVTLAASAIDGEDGDVSHFITWTSSVEGTVGTGAVVSWTPTAGGVHVITASVVDSAGMTGSANTSIAVDEPILVTFSTYKEKGRHQVDLRWTGAQGAQVEIHRSGSQTANITTANDGQYLDPINNKGRGQYSYEICEPGGLVCSAVVSVTF